MLTLLILTACTAPSATGSSGDTAPTQPSTAGTATTGDTGANALQRPIEWRGGMVTRLGQSLAFVDTPEPLLAMSSPGLGGYDDETLGHVSLCEPLVQNEGGSTQCAAKFWSENLEIPGILFGEEILAPGDVTGDGLDDLAVFDASDLQGHGAFLFHAPLLEPIERHAEDSPSPISGVPLRGAPCGDLDGDAIDDLCTASGVALGPITGPVDSWHTTWSATTPTADVHLAGAATVADGVGGLLVSDPNAAAVYRLTTFPAGDVDLALEASATWTAPAAPTGLAVGGDLDGDGDGDLVVAWDGAVAVSTTLGGDLLAAHTTWSGTATDLVIADFDGDGSDDLAIGTSGEVLLFLGPLDAGSLAREDASNILTGYDPPDDGFGHALAARDVDDDGAAELAVAAPQAPYEPGWESFPGGRVFLFHDPVAFSWDAFDPPLEPIYPAWVTEGR